MEQSILSRRQTSFFAVSEPHLLLQQTSYLGVSSLHGLTWMMDMNAQDAAAVQEDNAQARCSNF